MVTATASAVKVESMNNPIYAEYEILEVTYTPDHLIDTVVVRSHSRYIPGNDYRFTRALILNRIDDGETFFILRSGARIPVEAILIENNRFIRSDSQSITEDFIDLK